METINIICVDDQSDVLDAVTRDLRSLEQFYRVEGAESAEDCLSLMNEMDERGESVGLVISDHVMPGGNGVELLQKISSNPIFKETRKILLTGQANHADTIRAVNEAHIDNYFEKPWNPEDLLATTKSLLTSFVLDKGFEYKDFLPALDQVVLLSYLRKD